MFNNRSVQRLSYVGAAALSLLCAAPAMAVPQSFSIAGSGFAAPTGVFTAAGGEVKVTGAPYTFDDGAGTVEMDWALDATFLVAGLPSGPPGNSQGGGRFYNTLGDSIEVSFTGLNTDDPNASFDGDFDYSLTYAVTGGSGRFAGATGNGTETVQIFVSDFRFQGVGQLNLNPSQVPEPATAALACLALLAMAGAARKGAQRRRS